MAYELRQDASKRVVATLKTIQDCTNKAVEYMRAQGITDFRIVFGDDGTFQTMKTGTKTPVYSVVKIDLRSTPKAAEPSAAPRGRPKKDQTNLSLQAMPLGVGVWHELRGKDQRLYALPRPAPKAVVKSNPGGAVARNFNTDFTSIMALYCDEAGHVLQTEGFKPRKVGDKTVVLKINTTDEARKNLRDESEFPWPANATHVLVGTEKAGQFTGRWCFRKS
jgi:hypothetical protein